MLFDAIVFALQACGLTPNCAKREFNSAQLRMQKIEQMIATSRYGVHDISRVEYSPKELPRFNMPFELGLDKGCQVFGTKWQKDKSLLILDSKDHQYDLSTSDLSGFDPKYHHNNPDEAITCIRSWLAASPWTDGSKQLPGSTWIIGHYHKFRDELPKIVKQKHLDFDDLQFKELTEIIQEWLIVNPMLD